MTRRRHVELQHGRVDTEGRRLCCHCGQPIVKRRRDWCSDECALLYRVRTGQQNAMRLWLMRNRPMRCEICGLDFGHETMRRVHRFDWPWRDPHRDRRLERAWRWEADHRVPLAEGGDHEPDNLRILCVRCHRDETRDLRRRMAMTRRKETT